MWERVCWHGCLINVDDEFKRLPESNFQVAFLALIHTNHIWLETLHIKVDG